MKESNKKESIAALIKKGILVSPDFVDKVDSNTEANPDMLVLNKDATQLISKNEVGINWRELDKIRALHEQGKAQLPNLDELTPVAKPRILKEVQAISKYKPNSQKITVNDFTNYFITRYKLLEGILRSRTELQNLTSIHRLRDKAMSNNLSIIGMVNDKRETKKKNLMLTLEDATGKLRVIISRSKPDLFREALNIVPDEVIGFNGSFKKDMFFILLPVHSLSITPISISATLSQLACVGV